MYAFERCLPCFGSHVADSRRAVVYLNNSGECEQRVAHKLSDASQCGDVFHFRRIWIPNRTGMGNCQPHLWQCHRSSGSQICQTWRGARTASAHTGGRPRSLHFLNTYTHNFTCRTKTLTQELITPTLPNNGPLSSN